MIAVRCHIGHQRPERPAHLHPELNHPALREKGRVIPPRTIDKQAKVIYTIKILIEFFFFCNL